MAFKNFKAIILLPLFFLHCAPHNKASYLLGEVNFTATGKKEALPFFEKGFLLLHSFEYIDAAEEFRKARTIDPDFAMAYWGEAMTYNHPLWRYQNLDKAKEVLQLLAPTPEGRMAKAKTELEKDFIKSADVLYGEGSKAERDVKFASFMEQLYKKYKGDTEVASFYSLALIGSVPIGRNAVVYEKAAQIAKEVLQKNPRHPGALHYLIHAYDDPDNALKALQTADAYSVTAPDAGHALHMPTHIYLALGMWDKVVSSNEVSWAAGEKRKERKKLTNDALNYHAFHWLLYGYLQQGENEKAKKVLHDMKNYADELGSRRARSHIIYIKTTYLVETNNLEPGTVAINVPQKDLNIVTRAMNYFVHGWNAYHNKDENTLAGIIQKLSGERLIDMERVDPSGGAMCGGVDSELPNLLDLQYAEVMEMELKALQAWLKKDAVNTENWFKKATQLENNISYSYGPPAIVKPSNELYGEWLLEMDRPKESLHQFEIALKTAPKRKLSEEGKEKAVKKMGS
ncbi:MAG: tetratricopeptide repeat protein [Chitinophagaceae bacterium]